MLEGGKSFGSGRASGGVSRAAVHGRRELLFVPGERLETPVVHGLEMCREGVAKSQQIEDVEVDSHAIPGDADRTERGVRKVDVGSQRRLRPHEADAGTFVL
jgi:hypothetical protein